MCAAFRPHRQAALAAALVLVATALIVAVAAPASAGAVVLIANALAAGAIISALSIDQRCYGRTGHITPSAMSDLMAVLAHELSAPIVGVGAAAQVLARDLHGRACERTALGIAAESRRIHSLLEALSDVSAFESGRLSLSVRVVDLGELLQDGVVLTRRTIARSSSTSRASASW